MRTIAVTGSASGIGAATTRLLRAGGARVIGVDVRDAEVVADLSTRTGRDAAVAGIRALAGGRLDGLVTSAGLSSTIHDEPRVLSVNFFGTSALLRGLREDLAKGDRPAAALVSSFAMLLPSAVPAAIDACLAGDETRAIELVTQADPIGRSWPAYATSKLAVSKLVRHWAPSAEWAGAGITLNAVAPAVTRTPMIAQTLDDPEKRKVLLGAAPPPSGRIGEAEDVAELLCFLVSGRARQISGQVIFVDAGLEAKWRPDGVLPRPKP